jgi:hypothetical protein
VVDKQTEVLAVEIISMLLYNTTYRYDNNHRHVIIIIKDKLSLPLWWWWHVVMQCVLFIYWGPCVLCITDKMHSKFIWLSLTYNSANFNCHGNVSCHGNNSLYFSVNSNTSVLLCIYYECYKPNKAETCPFWESSLALFPVTVGSTAVIFLDKEYVAPL